jgi:hypothetical protein
VAAAWLLLLCATTLLTAGSLYGDAVALGGLRATMADAPPADRAVVVGATVRPADAPALDAPVRRELDRVLGFTGGEIARVMSSTSYADAAIDSAGVTELTKFASYEGLERHATLVEGSWPVSGATPQEAGLSAGAAELLGLRAGDRITLVSRLSQALRTEVQITAIWSPIASDPYWLDAELELAGSVVRGSFTTVAPFVIPADDLLARDFGDRLDMEWRALPDPDGFRIDDIARIRATADDLASALRATLPGGVQARVATDLPAILSSVDRSALVSRTGVLLLVIQFAVLAAYAIVLVAGMLSDRRRAETALLRSRGASSGHLAAMAFVEALLLTGLAAIMAPFVALVAVRWLGSTGPLASAGVTDSIGVSREALVVDGITAAACVVALVLPMLGGGPNLAGVRAAIARQSGRTLAQRLGLDLALVAVAVIALWQLRLYGAPLTRNARGVLGVDPLLVAAPGIGLLAGAIIATRLIPRIAEIGQRLLERGRGLVAPMGGRGMARRPLRYTRSALLLMLAAALGTFATAHVATWTQSQADQAGYQAGAPVRVVVSDRAPAAGVMGSSYAAIPGVSGLMPVDRQTLDAGRQVRGGEILALDATNATELVIPTPNDDGAALAGLFALLAAERPVAVGAAVPDGTLSLRIIVDTDFEAAFFDPEQEPPPDISGFGGVRASIVLEDGLGRLTRLSSGDAALLVGDGQVLTFDLQSGTAGEPRGLLAPVRVRAIELVPGAPPGTGAVGTLTLTGLEASASPATDAAGDWAPVDLAAGDEGWSWRYLGNNPQPISYSPTGGAWNITFGTEPGMLEPVFSGGFTAPTVRLTSEPLALGTVAGIASRGLLEATGAAVGEDVVATLSGTRVSIHVVGVLDTFPTLDPSEPFVVIDGPTLAIARFAANGSLRDPDEWWLAADDPATAAAAIAVGPDPDATVLTAAGLKTALSTDPVPLGVIGVLGLGSIAAMIFAAIGFIVSATVSTRERLGEFALLRALGLSGRQLSVWLSLENAFLLTIGLAAGVGLGLVLAWLVLPFSTLTSSGAVAVPSPTVIIPLATLLPIVVAAVGVFLVTLVILRRQLLTVRIGDVLRGRDE